MLVIGAGGHALEVLDVLEERSIEDEIFFFDDTNANQTTIKKYKVLKSVEEVISTLTKELEFIIAVGNPFVRRAFYERFSSVKGKFRSIKSITSFISNSSSGEEYDVMKNCFIGPASVIRTGSLINTGAQVHHGVYIGEFSEISPRAVLLGNASIGSYCTIGANSTVLPKIKIGSNVIIGAGSVVTKDLPDNCMAAGVPCVIKKYLQERDLFK
jgi:sugar O-acyltransferase (sialic acid O-acetyltransferase NeuD family)